VAAALGLEVLDTGAMYRAVTFAVLQGCVDPADDDAVAAVARRANVEVGERVVVNGVDATEAIRGPEVTALVSDALALAEMVSPKQFKSIADSLAVADQVAAAVLVVRLLVLASLLKEGLEMSGTAGPALTLSAISGRGLQLESTMKGG